MTESRRPYALLALPLLAVAIPLAICGMVGRSFGMMGLSFFGMYGALVLVAWSDRL